MDLAPKPQILQGPNQMLLVNPHRDLVLDGLVAWWPFDDGSGSVAKDMSGNARNLTLYNSPTWETGAVALNGSSQYGNIADSDAFTLGSEFTITFSVYLTGYSNSYGSVYKVTVASKDYGAASYREFTISISGTSNSYTKLEFFLFSSNSVYTSNTFDYTFSLNTQYNVVIKRASGVVYVYINGVAQTSQANTIAVQNTTSVLEVGRRYSASYPFYLKGKLLDLRFYSRCITDAEGQEIMNGRG